MARASHRHKPVKRAEAVRENVGEVSDACYICGKRLLPTDKIVRVHSLSIHRACYESDIDRRR